MKTIVYKALALLIMCSGVYMISCTKEDANSPLISEDSQLNDSQINLSARPVYTTFAGHPNAPFILSTRPGDGGCWCTEYVAARVDGLANMGSFPAAKNFGNSWLPNRGYYLVNYSANNLPQNKDIIVMQSGSHGISHPSGHVGIVGSAYLNGNTIKINVYGANQGKTPVKTVCGCPNESLMVVSTWEGDSSIQIWRKDGSVLYN